MDTVYDDPFVLCRLDFPFFSLLNGNLKWAEQLVIQALFLFANRKQKCVYFSLASCSANTRRLDAMKDRTPVWDYALHSGGLSAVRYTAVSLFFEDTDVSVFSLLCVVPSELDGDITEP